MVDRQAGGRTMPPGLGVSDRQQSSRRHVDTFVCPPEKHISVTSSELKQAIKNRLELEDRGTFEELCKLMEGMANFDFVDLKFRCVTRTSMYVIQDGANYVQATLLLCEGSAEGFSAEQ
eukprot:GHRR01015066.1.p5 GENE.GHRR01015066.1~~GHRR01015066.1.p5  ORF type:complete len:119 (+),score=30.24 GHRR01015066.1:871-1227(+)